MSTTEQRVRIVTDHDPMDPREWDNASRMICWHNRYNLGDEHGYSFDDFLRELAFEADDSLEDKVDWLENEEWDRLYDDSGSQYDATQAVEKVINDLVGKAILEGYVILPLYLYDHSGISMSTGQFACPWDSGQVGWIICDSETIKREFNGDRDLAEQCLESEVSTYNDYLTGNVYGFIVEGRDVCAEDACCAACDKFDTCDPDDDDAGWEDVDSCFGFFGPDPRVNGMAEHLGSDDLVDLAADAEIEP